MKSAEDGGTKTPRMCQGHNSKRVRAHSAATTGSSNVRHIVHTAAPHKYGIMNRICTLRSMLYFDAPASACRTPTSVLSERSATHAEELIVPSTLTRTVTSSVRSCASVRFAMYLPTYGKSGSPGCYHRCEPTFLAWGSGTYHWMRINALCGDDLLVMPNNPHGPSQFA